jgi:hypothetical protein
MILSSIVIEECSRLSRAVVVCLVATVVVGCSVDRAGLGGFDGAGGSPVVVDGHADSPADPGLGGRTGVGGQSGGIGGGTGTGGVAGGTGGASPDAAMTDAVDAPVPGDAAGDGGPDRPADNAGDRPVGDLAPDGLTCGASPLCDSSAINVTLPGGRFTGTTSGVSLDQGSCGGDRAPEAVYRLVLTARSDVFVTTHGTAFDTAVYMRNGCCGAEVACNDDADNRSTSVLSVRGLAAGTYYIFVDGRNNSDQSGAFTVDIYATAASTAVTDDCGSPGHIANLAVTGTTCGMQNDFSPLAGCLVPPLTTSFDTVYYFVLDAPMTTVVFNTCANTCIDTVLAIRDVCTTPTTQRACNDNFCAPAAGVCPVGAGPTQSRVTTATLTAGVHYLILDTHVIATPTGCGAYTITPVGVPQ